MYVYDWKPSYMLFNIIGILLVERIGCPWTMGMILYLISIEMYWLTIMKCFISFVLADPRTSRRLGPRDRGGL